MPAQKNKSGFTLVELLVVITIIAILAAVGLTVYKGAEKHGRMAKRIEDLKAIQVALELYYANNKTYPKTADTPVTWRSECDGWKPVDLATNGVVPNLVPTYMVAFPSDPAMDTGNNKNCYLYASDGIDYKVLDYRVTEIKNNCTSSTNCPDLQSQLTLWDPFHPYHPQVCSSTDLDRSFAVYSSGGRCW